LILGKINKIVATSCQIVRLRCTKFDFGWGSVPDPAWSLQCSQTPYLKAGYKGPTFKETKRRGSKGGRGEGRKRKGGSVGINGEVGPSLFRPN